MDAVPLDARTTTRLAAGREKVRRRGEERRDRDMMYLGVERVLEETQTGRPLFPVAIRLKAARSRLSSSKQLFPRFLLGEIECDTTTRKS